MRGTMKYLSTLSTFLLASACVMAITPASAQDASSANVKVADASTQSSSSAPEIINIAPQDQQGGSGGGSNVGTIDVQGAGTTLGNGYIVPEDGPKERSTVTHQGIENLLPTSNPYQIISMLPGVSQFQDDALGISGGTIRVRGLTAAEMGFTVNGAPINDSGNFAVYPNELIDAENVAQMWVSQGSTDIDAPHVGASGGNIGVVTRAPMDTFNVRYGELVGQDAALREFLSVDSGWIGNFKGFFSVSEIGADKWRGDGRDNRWHSDGNLLYQFLPHSSIGLIWSFNDGINHTYRAYAESGSYDVEISGQSALQTFDEIGGKADYDTFWGGPNDPINLYGPYASHPGNCATFASPLCTVTNPNFPQLGTTNVSNDYKLDLNVFKNALVTLPIHVQLTDDLRWETNGYVWYGDGGTGFGEITEQGYNYIDGYIPGAAYVAQGNTNGVANQNEILTYEFEHTLTTRPGFTSKMIWDIYNTTIMGGIWYEHASQKQNEPVTLVNPDGTPCNNDPTDAGSCSLIGTSALGTGPIEGYADKVDSVGQSAYFEVTNRFLDDALKVTFGLSLRNIQRSDHTYEPVCFDSPNLSYQLETNGSHVSCASIATSSTFLNSAAYQYFGGPTIGAAAAYAAMQQYAANPHIGYTRMLPELNFTFDLDTFQQIYAGVSTGFRTPSTNNLWQDNSAGTILETTNIKPEYDTTWEAGYRYHGDFVTASTTAYLQDITNYLAEAQVDEEDYITSNIGGVKIYGVDGELGTAPWHGFTFYGSATLQNSALQSNVAAYNSGANVIYVYSKGKQLVDTPNWIANVSVGYEQDGFFASVTPHCYGQRATALLNDEFVPSNCTVDASVGYHFNEQWGYLSDATLRLYAKNLFDSSYLGEITTTAQSNAHATTGYSPTLAGALPVPAQSYSAYPGAPLFIGAELHVNLN
jgi:iron complex outermembrane recepter protein